MASAVSKPAVPRLAHARDDEDLVVHREPEEHREDEDRHPALDLADVVGAAAPSRARRSERPLPTARRSPPLRRGRAASRLGAAPASERRAARPRRRARGRRARSRGTRRRRPRGSRPPGRPRRRRRPRRPWVGACQGSGCFAAVRPDAGRPRCRSRGGRRRRSGRSARWR